LRISFQEAFHYPKPGNAIAHCGELGISQETRFDTLTPINLIFYFYVRRVQSVAWHYSWGCPGHLWETTKIWIYY